MKYAYMTKKLVNSRDATTTIKNDATNSRVRQMKMLVVFTDTWLLKVGALMVETVAADVWLPTLKANDMACTILTLMFLRNVRRYLYPTDLHTIVHVYCFGLNAVTY